MQMQDIASHRVQVLRLRSIHRIGGRPIDAIGMVGGVAGDAPYAWSGSKAEGCWMSCLGLARWHIQFGHVDVADRPSICKCRWACCAFLETRFLMAHRPRQRLPSHGSDVACLLHWPMHQEELIRGRTPTPGRTVQRTYTSCNEFGRNGHKTCQAMDGLDRL